MLLSFVASYKYICTVRLSVFPILRPASAMERRIFTSIFAVVEFSRATAVGGDHDGNMATTPLSRDSRWPVSSANDQRFQVIVVVLVIVVVTLLKVTFADHLQPLRYRSCCRAWCHCVSTPSFPDSQTRSFYGVGMCISNNSIICSTPSMSR